MQYFLRGLTEILAFLSLHGLVVFYLLASDPFALPMYLQTRRFLARESCGPFKNSC